MRAISIVVEGQEPPTVSRIAAGSEDCSIGVGRVIDVTGGGGEPLYRATLAADVGDAISLSGYTLIVGSGDRSFTLKSGEKGYEQTAALPDALVGVAGGATSNTMALIGPGLMLALWVLAWGLIVTLRRRGAPAEEDAPGSPRAGARAVIVGLVAAAAGTWPMLAAGDALVQRNFDGFGSAWQLWRLSPLGRPELPIPRFETASMLWGTGQLGRLLDPVTVYHLSAALGVFLSFVATEWVVRRVFGVRSPLSWIAGLGYALCPLAGTALVEGHGGWLLGAGLPLLIGLTCRRASRARGWRWAAGVVGAGLLLAGQSGYLLVMGALAVPLLCLGLRRPFWRVALLALPAAALYAALVVPDMMEGSGSDPLAYFRALEIPEADVATLDTLAGIPPGSELPLNYARHSLLYTLLVGGVLLPLVRRRRQDVVLACLALVGVVLSFGPSLLGTFTPNAPPIVSSMPYAWLVYLVPALAVFRFPVRFLWLYYGAASLGAAITAGWLAGRSRVLAFGLVGLTLAEVLFFAMRPWEPRQTLRDAPSAYQHLSPEDRVYDLWPSYPQGHGQAMQLQQLGCYYQIQHGAALAIDCVDIEAETGLQAQALPELLSAVSTDAPDRAVENLRSAGVTALAYHPDAFPPEQRARLQQILDAWWPLVSESADGGEAVRIYRVQETEPSGWRPERRAVASAPRCPPVTLPVSLASAPEAPRPWPLVGLAAAIAAGWLALVWLLSRARS